MSDNETSSVIRLSGVDPITFVPRLVAAFANRRFISCSRGLAFAGHRDRWVEPSVRAVGEDAVIVRLDGHDGEVVAWMTASARAALVDRTSYHDASGSTGTWRQVYVAGQVVFERHESNLDRDPDEDAPVPDAREAMLPPDVLARLSPSAAALFTCTNLDGLDEWDAFAAWAAKHPAPEPPPPQSDDIPF